MNGIKIKRNFGTIKCQMCNAETNRSNAIQKYCPPCSEIKDFERKRKWSKENPQKITLEQVKATQEKKESECIARGLEINKKNTSNIQWFSDSDPNISKTVKVSVPFTYSFSKNAIFSMNTKIGHVFLRKKAKGVRDDLTRVISNSMKGLEPFKKNKIWLDIFVQKPNNKGDAVNVIDSVCDAVKVAIGIDDRYFSIRRLDWEIVKENPSLFVSIGQEEFKESFLCSYCGQAREMENLSSKRRCCALCFASKRKKKS